MTEQLEWEARKGAIVAVGQRSGAVYAIYEADGVIFLSWLHHEEGGLLVFHNIIDAKLHAKHVEATFAFKALKRKHPWRSEERRAHPG